MPLRGLKSVYSISETPSCNLAPRDCDLIAIVALLSLLAVAEFDGAPDADRRGVGLHGTARFAQTSCVACSLIDALWARQEEDGGAQR